MNIIFQNCVPSIEGKHWLCHPTKPYKTYYSYEIGYQLWKYTHAGFTTYSGTSTIVCIYPEHIYFLSYKI